MIRKVIREKVDNNEDYFERLKIGVVSICSGSGASFIALSLSKLLGEYENNRITYIEVKDEIRLGEKCIYDSIGVDRRFRDTSGLCDLCHTGLVIGFLTKDFPGGINNNLLSKFSFLCLEFTEGIFFIH